jgi:hypothetical protein
VLFLQVNASAQKLHIGNENNSEFRVRITRKPALVSISSSLDYHLYAQLKKSLKGHIFFCKEDV